MAVHVAEVLVMVFAVFLFIITLPFSLFFCYKTIRHYERAVIFRLGRLRYQDVKGPGMLFVLVCIDSVRIIDLRTVTLDVPPQDLLTKDSVSVTVDAVVYYRIMDPISSCINVKNCSYSTKLLAMTTLRNILGTKSLTELLTDREAISAMLREILDIATDPWGVKIERVEITDVRLPDQLQKAMAAEAEAAREARAKVIAAEGELKASRALKEASDVMVENPVTLQLRYLSTLDNIASNRTTTVIFPVPMQMLYQPKNPPPTPRKVKTLQSTHSVFAWESNPYHMFANPSTTSSLYMPPYELRTSRHKPPTVKQAKHDDLPSIEEETYLHQQETVDPVALSTPVSDPVPRHEPDHKADLKLYPEPVLKPYRELDLKPYVEQDFKLHPKPYREPDLKPYSEPDLKPHPELDLKQNLKRDAEPDHPQDPVQYRLPVKDSSARLEPPTEDLPKPTKTAAIPMPYPVPHPEPDLKPDLKPHLKPDLEPDLKRNLKPDAEPDHPQDPTQYRLPVKDSSARLESPTEDLPKPTKTVAIPMPYPVPHPEPDLKPDLKSNLKQNLEPDTPQEPVQYQVPVKYSIATSIPPAEDFPKPTTSSPVKNKSPSTIIFEAQRYLARHRDKAKQKPSTKKPPNS